MARSPATKPVNKTDPKPRKSKNTVTSKVPATEDSSKEGTEENITTISKSL